MDWQTLGAFLAATMVFLLTPGPVMAVIIGNTLNGGQVAGIRTVLGVELGEVLLIGLLALSFLLTDHLMGDFFPWLSLASAVYLAWLAASTVLSRSGPVHREIRRLSSRPLFDGLAVTVSNPTALLFYSAFFMPFVQANQPLAAQLGILAVLYLLVNLVFDLACVIFIARFAVLRERSTRFVLIARLSSAAIYLGTSGLAVASFLRATAL